MPGVVFGTVPYPGFIPPIIAVRPVTKRDDIIVNPGYLPWAGVATFKKAYQIYQERGYRSRLLAAAYRHHLHWSELIGATDCLLGPDRGGGAGRPEADHD